MSLINYRPSRNVLSRFAFTVAFLLLASSAFALPSETSQRLAVAQALVGTREVPTNSNRGEIIDEANRLSNVPLGSPWCASITRLTFYKVRHVIDVPGAWSPSWYVRARLIPANQAQVGDVGLVWFPSLKRFGHVICAIERVHKRGGIVIAYDTLEGNTNAVGSREGDGFYRRHRQADSVTLVRW